MKTRTGKIARLPKSIRDELNLRLENGKQGPELLAWLNALPEVQQILAQQFGGRFINAQNLTEWRHGGYPDWSNERTGRAQWHDLLERGSALHEKRTTDTGTDVTSYLSTFLLVELNEAIDELHRIKDSAKRHKTLNMISRVLANLQNAHSREKRIRLWQLQQQTLLDQIKPNQPESASKKILFPHAPA